MTETNTVSRGQFFGFGAKGAVALVAGGSLLAQTTGRPGFNPENEDGTVCWTS